MEISGKRQGAMCVGGLSVDIYTDREALATKERGGTSNTHTQTERESSSSSSKQGTTETRGNNVDYTHTHT